jgi:hypothetical protein
MPKCPSHDDIPLDVIRWDFRSFGMMSRLVISAIPLPGFVTTPPTHIQCSGTFGRQCASASITTRKRVRVTSWFVIVRWVRDSTTPEFPYNLLKTPFTWISIHGIPNSLGGDLCKTTTFKRHDVTAYVAQPSGSVAQALVVVRRPHHLSRVCGDSRET